MKGSAVYFLVIPIFYEKMCMTFAAIFDLSILLRRRIKESDTCLTPVQYCLHFVTCLFQTFTSIDRYLLGLLIS